jgi:DNA-binding Lrp family transcriptional regulator
MTGLPGETDMAAKPARKGMKAYVLIETAPGKTKAVKKELTRLSGGSSTLAHLDAVTGPYDFIAVVQGPTLDAVGRLVTDEIGAIDGVTRTTTCVAVSLA